MKIQRVSAIAGLTAPLVVFGFVLASIASWSSFSWTDNALSDLGVQPGATSVLFNAGLVVGGILFLAFAIGLFTFAGKRLVGKAGAVAFAVACLMLIAIGIFNENYKPTHFIVSVGLFTFLPISLLIFTASFWLEGKRLFSAITFLLAVFAAAVWALQYTFHYLPNVAIPETASSLAGAVWIVAVGLLMLKEKPETGSHSSV